MADDQLSCNTTPGALPGLLPLVEACLVAIDLEAARILVAPGFSEPD